jgi:hypothetical protein
MKTADLLNAWQQVPAEIDTLISGRSDAQLAKIPGSEGLSLKELVHHLTEANIVAATMIIAALGASGSTFDWSWLWPNREWTDRMGYGKVPTATSLRTLENMIAHVSNVVKAAGRGALKRKVRLFDSPGAETYTKTVAELIQQEVDHAAQHLVDVRKAGHTGRRKK